MRLRDKTMNGATKGAAFIFDCLSMFLLSLQFISQAVKCCEKLQVTYLCTKSLIYMDSKVESLLGLLSLLGFCVHTESCPILLHYCPRRTPLTLHWAPTCDHLFSACPLLCAKHQVRTPYFPPLVYKCG